jgi:uncharacterized membrane protein
VAGEIARSLPWSSPYLRNLAAGSLQLALATLAASALAAWWAGRVCARRWVPTVSERGARCLVAVLAGTYAVGLTALSLVRHRAGLTGVWDLGYYAQLAWQLADGHLPRSSVWHDAPWGNHATFVLVAVAPFLRLVPDPAVLLAVQSLALALGGIPAYILGRGVWGTPGAGLVAAAAYLLYPALQFLNLFDFHADAFATPLLLAAFAALVADRIGWALAWAALLLLVKEEMALVAACFGVYVAVFHRRRAGLGLAGAAVAAFGLLVWVVIPAWIHSPYFALFNRWPHLGRTPLEWALSPVLQPAAFFGTLLAPERLGYLALLTVPLAGLPLLAPEILAVGIVPLASNLLSGTEGQYTIRAHYTAALTPVLVAAAVVGGRRAAAWLGPISAARVPVMAGLLAASVAASLSFSPMPWSRDPFARKQFWNAEPRQGLPRIAAAIPPDASVSAANHLGAHVALRKTLRLFPDGWESADMVLVDLAGREYVGAAPNADLFRPLLRTLVTTRRLAHLHDHLAVFDRGAPSPDAAARLFALRHGPAHGPEVAWAMMPVAVHTAPADLAPREHLTVRYTWAVGEDGAGTPCVLEVLAPLSGPPLVRRTRPAFYGLLDGRKWPAGTLAEEVASARVPETASPGTYAWSVAAWDDRGSGSCGDPPGDLVPQRVAAVRVRPW